MNRSPYRENQWVLWYAVSGIALASLVSLHTLGAVEYADSTLAGMTTMGAVILLFVAIVHYAAVYYDR